MSGHMAAVLCVSPQSVQCLHLSYSTDGAEQKESASLRKYLLQFSDWLVSVVWSEFWICMHLHVGLRMGIEVFNLEGEDR